MLSYVFRYKFSFLLAILIALLSLVPSSSMPDSRLFSIRFLDKFVHCAMYASIGFVALIESRCQSRCVRYHMLLLLLLFIMSAAIEVLQATVVATRSAEWFALIANFLGLAAAYFAFQVFKRLGVFKTLKF